jgi:hypothetical protein
VGLPAVVDAMSNAVYRFLADLIVVVHFAYVAFVVLGLVVILLGIVRRWSWVRNFWLRALHLLLIGVVVFESVCGIVCPLTEWEDKLRELAGETVESGTFIGRWAHELLFLDLPPLSIVFTISYCIFGLVVLCTWFLAPPRWPWKKETTTAEKPTG